jgi:hypothetical protein
MNYRFPNETMSYSNSMNRTRSKDYGRGIIGTACNSNLKPSLKMQAVRVLLSQDLLKTPYQ